MPTLAHKIRLTPTPEQVVYFKKACRTARFTYNWALAEWQRQYHAGQKPSALGLKKQLNAIKRRDFPWVLDVTKCASEGAFMNLGKAFTNFFAKRTKYPCFHKKGVHDRFMIAHDGSPPVRRQVHVGGHLTNCRPVVCVVHCRNVHVTLSFMRKPSTGGRGCGGEDVGDII
jgi:hypothetical protein